MGEKRHVAVIPFPFTSHPISLLNVVIRLAKSSPTTLFSFLSTPILTASLSKPSSADLPTNLKHYPIGDGLPPSYSSAAGELDIDGRQIELFLGGLPPPARNLRRALEAASAGEGMAVTFLVVDVLLSVHAAEVDLPWVAVWSPSPFSLSIAVHAELLRLGTPGAAEFVPGLPEQIRVHENWPSDVTLSNPGSFPFREEFRGLVRVLPLASAVVMNSFREMYPEALNLDLESRLTILNVGFHTVPNPRSSDSDPGGCMTWLDGQKPRSVAYLSFGTVIGFSDEELTTVSEALEERGNSAPFVWSLPERQRLILPSGFEERTRLYGKIVPWANQTQVLGHASIGVHVSHSGCNSVNESVAAGVPMIVRPFWADNHINARMVESVWKIGVGVRGGVFTKTGLVDALEMVLEREEGMEMRERALELKNLTSLSSAPNGSATADFNNLLRLLQD